MARSKEPLAPYAKATSTPLPAPQTNSAVNYAQLPENVMWLSGDRGFVKRPGSRVVATIDNSYSSTTTTPATVCGLLSVLTPTSLLNTATFVGDQAPDTLLTGPRHVLAARAVSVSSTASFNYGDLQSDVAPITRLSGVSAYTANDQQVFSRALYGRDEGRYGFSVGLSQTLIPSNSLIGDAPSVTVNTRYNPGALSLGAIAAERLPVRRNTSASATQVKTAILPLPVRWSNPVMNNASTLSTPRPFAAGLGARVDVASLTTGTFIGGGAGPLMYYDGNRVFRSGTQDLSSSTLTLVDSAVGVLSAGTYKYFVTHVVYLQSGEILEGVPTPLTSITLGANRQVQVSVATSNLPSADGFNEFASCSYALGGYATNYTLTPTDASGILEFRGGQKVLMIGTDGKTALVTINVPTNSNRFYTGFLPAITADNQIQIAADSQTAAAAMTSTGYLSFGGCYRIYRTAANGSTLYKIAEIPIVSRSVAPGFTDNTPDSSLTQAYASSAVTPRAAPDITYAVEDHSGRTFILTNNLAVYNATSVNQYSSRVSYAAPTVMFSSALSRHYFPVDNSFELANAGTACGLVSLNDVLYIITSKKVFYVQGTFDDATTYTINLLTDAYGCKDPRSIVKYGNAIYFVSQAGLVKITGMAVDLDFGAPISKHLQEDVVTSACTWPSKNLLMLTVAAALRNMSYNSGGPPQNQYNPASDSTAAAYISSYDVASAYTLVCDMTTGRWSKWGINCFGGGCELDGDFWYTGGESMTATTASIRRLSLAHNWTDDGVPFTARYYTEWYDAGIPAVDKSFDRAQIFSTDTVEAGGQGFKLTVRTERDWQPGLTVDTFQLNDFKVDHGYAEQPYGYEPYGDPELSQKVLPLSNQRCKSLRLVLENAEANKNFAINGVGVEINPKYVNMKDE